MKRDINSLSRCRFDLLVLGCGIYGATIAYEATLQGLKVAIIDKCDFGGVTSSNSLKFIHGGLRYLKSFRPDLTRESILARKELVQLAPHLFRVIPVVIPLRKNGIMSKIVMKSALHFYGALSIDRNNGVASELKTSNGRLLNQCDFAECVSGFNSQYSSGMEWEEIQILNSERLILNFIKNAENRGAVVANYVKAIDYRLKSDTVTNVTVEDLISGETFEVNTRFVVNATGVWADSTKPVNVVKSKTSWSTAVNIVLNKNLSGNKAIGFYPRETAKGQSLKAFFLVPWFNYSMVGTLHQPFQGNPDNVGIGEKDIKAFLELINSSDLGVEICEDDISFVHFGYLPVRSQTQQLKLTMESTIENWAKNYISVAGVKYSTSYVTAKKVVNRVMSSLGASKKRLKITDRILDEGDYPSLDELSKAMNDDLGSHFRPEIIEHLKQNYGAHYQDVIQLTMDDVTMKELVPGSKTVLKAELLYAIKNEIPMKLEDLILRRTVLGAAQYPGNKTIDMSAKLMAKHMSWSEQKTNQEIEATKNTYRSMMIDLDK